MSVLLLDTNLLLLYLAGMTDRRAVAKIRRLSAYTTGDFDRLARFAGAFNKFLFTPNTITETSNLLRSGAQTPAATAILDNMRLFLDRFGERYVPSSQAASHPEASRLGITDAVLLILAETGANLLTADLDLYVAAIRAKLAATNFAHIRDHRA